MYAFGATGQTTSDQLAAIVRKESRKHPLESDPPAKYHSEQRGAADRKSHLFQDSSDIKDYVKKFFWEMSVLSWTVY
jgi:hypothetical protein